METNKYPPGSVRALLNTELVTPATRQALATRLEADSKSYTMRFFDEQATIILKAVCTRLFPATPAQINLAKALDERLTANQGDGWRYANMPPDQEMHRQGLQGLNETAQSLFQQPFIKLSSEQQDNILKMVQRGEVNSSGWQKLDPKRYFEELLAALTEFYYSHPLIQEEIGYVGMADAKGWQAIGLNQLESREPKKPDPDYVARLKGRGILPPTRQTSSDAARNTPASPPMRHYALDEAVDAVVIGRGAGGAPLLARLAAAGLKVVGLEAGKHWQPSTDFATDERAQAKLFWNDERLSAGADPLAFGSNNSGCGVGGSTLHYTAYTPRAQPDDLRLFSEFGVGADWPLTYTDLEPYYDELEGFLGISGPSPYPWGPARKQAYPLAPLPLNGAARLMERGCASLGIRTSPAANAALSARYFQPGVGWRAACTNRGFCQAGCSVGAKASTDVTFIPVALQAGAELRAESFVPRFEREAQSGRVNGVIYTQGGQEYRQRCRAVFLCAGAIETPRLLLLNNLANSNGQVGRNFMAHCGIQVWGQFEEEVRPYKGIPGGLISEDTHRPAGADFAGGYLLQSIGVMPLTYATQVARGQGLWGKAFDEHMQNYNHTAGINILGESLPQSQNYLELADELDERGLPKPRIHFSLSENDRRMTLHAETLMRQIWEQAGASQIWSFPRQAHTIGTCRMGYDPAQAVVKADGQTFEVANLYIVDNSVFPSSLSVNPALTIMALSLRVADQFLARAGRREI